MNKLISIAEKLYPGYTSFEDEDDSSFGGPYFEWGIYEYDPILTYLADKYGGKVEYRKELDIYQGDEFVLMSSSNDSDTWYRVLVFGFGSCTGCDALQSCKSYEEIDNIITSFDSSIGYFNNVDELKEYVNDEYHRENNWWMFNETFRVEVRAYINSLK